MTRSLVVCAIPVQDCKYPNSALSLAVRPAVQPRTSRANCTAQHFARLTALTTWLPSPPWKCWRLLPCHGASCWARPSPGFLPVLNSPALAVMDHTFARPSRRMAYVPDGTRKPEGPSPSFASLPSMSGRSCSGARRSSSSESDGERSWPGLGGPWKKLRQALWPATWPLGRPFFRRVLILKLCRDEGGTRLIRALPLRLGRAAARRVASVDNGLQTSSESPY